MAALRLLVVALALLLPYSQAQNLIGGSSTIADYTKALITSFNKNPGPSFPGTYESTNSQLGINKFKSGQFLVGVSIRPFDAADEAGAAAKLTIPFAILTVSPFSSQATAANFALSPSQVANILLGKTTSWSQLPGSGLKGPITFVGRSDEAAVTSLVLDYLRAALGASWPAKFTGEGPFKFGAPKAIYVKGAAAVGSTIKSTPGSFGFQQSGIGFNVYGLKEILLKNRAGKPVGLYKAPKADVYAAIPVSPPSFKGPWTQKYVWKAGPQTYPIVTFAYAFFKPSYSSTYGSVVKSFGVYILRPGQNIANSFNFFNLSQAKYLTPATSAIKSIVVK